jgi:hypothetical protein
MLTPLQAGHLTSRGLIGDGVSGAEFDFEAGIFSAIGEATIKVLLHQPNPNHHPIARNLWYQA